MNSAEGMWAKLASKRYREEFALALLKRSVAFQIKTLRKNHCGSQAALAERAKVTQGVVSRAEDQDYGNLTFNTVGRIAGGLDMAFIGRFVSFSDLMRFSRQLSEDEFISIPTFTEEQDRALDDKVHCDNVPHDEIVEASKGQPKSKAEVVIPLPEQRQAQGTNAPIPITQGLQRQTSERPPSMPLREMRAAG
jgi:transcriptional regulator with XRE-family HTH domain